jgi:hypothetical protein
MMTECVFINGNKVEHVLENMIFGHFPSFHQNPLKWAQKGVKNEAGGVSCEVGPKIQKMSFLEFCMELSGATLEKVENTFGAAWATVLDEKTSKTSKNTKVKNCVFRGRDTSFRPSRGVWEAQKHVWE